MFYRIAAFLVRIYMRLWFGLKLVDMDKVPTEGAVMLCANHKSYWDPPTVGCCMPRPVSFMAKAELFQNKLFGALIRALGAFPIRRGAVDSTAIRELMKRFRQNEAVVVFPQGTRERPGHPQPKAKPGLIKIALHEQIPIVPIGISGTYTFRGHITIKAGDPIFLPPCDKEAMTPEFLADTADSIMEKINALREDI